MFGCATEAPPRLGCRARCAIGFLPWVRAFPPRVAVRSRLAGVLTTRGACPARPDTPRVSEMICAGRVRAAAWGAFSSCARRWACARSRSPAPSSSAQVVCAERNRRPMPAGMCNGGAKAFAAAARPPARMPRKGRRIVLPNAPHRTPEDLELGRIHPRPEAHAFLRRADCPGHRPRGGAVRLGAQPARPRRSGVHRPARPRRPHPGGLRGGRRQGAAGARPRAAPRVLHRRAREGGLAGREREPQAPHRRGGGARRAGPDLQPQRDPAVPHRGPHRHGGGEAAPLPLPRPPPAGGAAPAALALADERGHPARAPRARLPRVGDALPGQVHARRRPQLPRPGAPPARQVLCAGGEPAAVQAALHGGGVRPVLPDREVLPRRGPRGSTASPSSPRSTWRCPSSRRTTCSRWWRSW